MNDLQAGNPGVVYLVGAGPGDPGLITLRGFSLLCQADVVIYDRLANSSLLEYAPLAEWIDVGKQPDRHPVPQHEINTLLIDKALEGKIVVRLKGGDPFVFGRGGEEALALYNAGVRFEIIPGVTSAIAVPAYAGIPVTYRGIAQSVTFVTGHGSSSEDSLPDFGRFADMQGTLVVMMGVKTLPLIVNELIAAGRSPQTPIALIERGTCAQQNTVTGTLETITELASKVRPPAIIVIGDVVNLSESLHWFVSPDARPLSGLCILDTRPNVIRKNKYIPVDEFRFKLVDLGARVIHLPTANIVPAHNSRALTEPLDHLINPHANHPAYDRILFTSATAVEFFFDQLLQFQFDARLLAGLKLTAIGHETASALCRHHLLADDTIPKGPIEFIVSEIRHMNTDRLLMVHSDADIPDLHTALQNNQNRVDELLPCTLQPIEPQTAAIAHLIDGKADLITFFSPSAFNGLVDALQSFQPNLEISSILSRMTVACIDSTTADVIRSSGIQVDLVSESDTIDSMIKTLNQWRAL